MTCGQCFHNRGQSIYFAGALLRIDSNRWRNVPIVLMAGKKMDERVGYARILFKDRKISPRIKKSGVRPLLFVKTYRFIVLCIIIYIYACMFFIFSNIFFLLFRMSDVSAGSFPHRSWYLENSSDTGQSRFKYESALYAQRVDLDN